MRRERLDTVHATIPSSLAESVIVSWPLTWRDGAGMEAGLPSSRRATGHANYIHIDIDYIRPFVSGLVGSSCQCNFTSASISSPFNMSTTATTDIPSTDPKPQAASGNDAPTTTHAEEAPNSIPENPFDSKLTRVLFDAIDQLQSTGASQDIQIPQVRVTHILAM
jgi:hypothetical protein